MSRASSRRSLAPEAGRPCLAHSQNFIRDPALVRRLLGQIELGSADTIIEIGPGRGAITGELARLAPRVLAVEADPHLALALLRRFATCRRTSIACGDFLDFPLPARPFVSIGNIPFDRTAEIVRKLTGERSGLTAAYLIMQCEAAAKFSGRPPGPFSLLSHLLQVEHDVEIICGVPRGCFSPRPGVDAAFARFRRRRVPILAGEQARQFRDLLSYLYPRGPLLDDALRKVLTRRQLKRLRRSLGLQADRRLSEVSFAEWLVVFGAFGEHASPGARATVRSAHARLIREQACLSKRYRTSRR
jgi:23S rRNA (adenine-N6)-dimethyltransferase